MRFLEKYNKVVKSYNKAFLDAKNEIIESISSIKVNNGTKQISDSPYCFTIKISSLANNNWSFAPEDYDISKQKAEIIKAIKSYDSITKIVAYLNNISQSRRIPVSGNHKINVDASLYKELLSLTKEINESIV